MGEASVIPSKTSMIATLLLILASSLPQLSAQTVNYTFVYGYVLDENGSGLSSVRILVSAQDGSVKTLSYTNSDGYFGLLLERGYTYTLTFSKPGYVTVTRSINAQKFDMNIGNITLREAIRVTSMTATIASTAGSDISIPVTISNEGEVAELLTLSVEKPEEWGVRIVYQNREVLSIVLSKGQSISMDVILSIPKDALEGLYKLTIIVNGTLMLRKVFYIYVQPQPTVRIYGSVLDDDGSALGNVKIDVYSQDGILIGCFESLTDGSFYLVLPSVSKSMSLTFSKPGYVKLSKVVSISSGELDLGALTLRKAIKLRSQMVSLSTDPGRKIQLPLTISNLADEAKMVELSVDKPASWLTRILLQNQEVSKILLQPNEAVNLQLEIFIPIDSRGQYTLTLKASSDIVSAIEFMVYVNPLTSTILYCPIPGRTAIPGDTVRFQVKVRNPVELDQRFKVSVEPTIIGWVVSVKTLDGTPVSEVTLPSAGSLDLIVDISIPSTVSDGVYKLTLKADSGILSDEIDLRIDVKRAPPYIKLVAAPPYIDVYSGSDARFKILVQNMGGYDELLDLFVEGIPGGWRYRFEDSGRQEITKLYVEAGRSKEFYLVVSVPSASSLGTVDLTVYAKSSDVSDRIDLKLNILGLYKLSIITQNFYTSLTVGGETTFTLTVKNTGSRDTTNVKLLYSSIPSGFNIDVSPTSLSVLRVGEEASFTIRISTTPDINAGNYYIDFTLSSDQVPPSQFTLRVELFHETSWLLYGGIAIVLALTSLFLMYRRIGRR
ncbi:carboxypeptidase regulatory-like domain-containing protein [Candidatus Bathyarchaeota archaeon]|nr:carboxypeptidase regulatory-like domain-containing protein [Candidatus Bathyarchaeota archaeon]